MIEPAEDRPAVAERIIEEEGETTKEEIKILAKAKQDQKRADLKQQKQLE